ncbi:PhoX family phosphatase [Inhella sp.]|uniref:PhoX family protein n=1 Tax=Inhella sp. TaxID=1921806 RepID=UPI0035AE7DB9
MSRRRFLQHLAVGGLSPLAASFAAPAWARPVSGYGPLRPVADEHTGLPLLMLPEGFSYRSFAWAGEALVNGGVAPGAADGMGIVKAEGEVFTLVRNHELLGFGGSFGSTATHYDPPCGGGAVTLRYDRAAGKLLELRGSLSGTLVNCAGGLTPWNSWLSCEEIVAPAGKSGRMGGREYKLEKAHGFVFEVPADRGSDAQALTALGQFKHEAALVDGDGTVYLTEDAQPAGFYRLLPTRKGQLTAGGRLQMLRVKARPDLRRGLKQGQRFDVDWVDIERPAEGVGTNGFNGVLLQGQVQGASLFTRLEGLHNGSDEIFFTSTDGGDAGAGQVWRFVPSKQQLELFLESPGSEVLDYPDNLILHPRKPMMVICEDSKQPVQRLYGVTRPLDGAAPGWFELARNNVQLNGEHLGWKGDFRGAEWAGCCFSPDGRTLFANVYRPGFTVAISGPF